MQQNPTRSCVYSELALSGSAHLPVPELKTPTLSSLSATFSVKSWRQAARRATNAMLRCQMVNNTLQYSVVGREQLVDISVVRRRRRRSTQHTVLQRLTQLVAVNASPTTYQLLDYRHHIDDEQKSADNEPVVRQHAKWFNVDTVQCAVSRCHDDIQRVATALGWTSHMLHYVERCQQVG